MATKFQTPGTRLLSPDQKHVVTYGDINEQAGTQFQRSTKATSQDLIDLGAYDPNKPISSTNAYPKPLFEDTNQSALDEYFNNLKAEARPNITDPYSASNIQAEESAIRREAQLIGEKLGLSTTEIEAAIPISTIDEQKRALARLQDSYNRQSESLDIAERLDVGATNLAKQGLRSQQAAIMANLSEGRQGATTSAAPKAIRTLDTILSERKAQADLRLEQAQIGRSEARANLEAAKESGDRAAIKRAQADLTLAENAIKERETEALQVAQQGAELALKTQAQQIDNATAFIDTIGSMPGLTAQGALTIAQQFSVPTGLASEYYLATESIRQDKSLDQDAKQVALDQAKFDFQNNIVDGAIAQQNKIALYQQLVKDGGDPVALAAQLDIKNELNPIYQSELALKKAQADIATAEANGQPVGWKERQEYMQYLADKQYATGQVDVVLPGKAGRFGITPTAGGILVDVMEGDKPNLISTVRDEGQCGAFVNDVLGTSLGNSFADKMKNTDPYAMPKPGMFFVQQTAAQWGHCGIVESINEDGTLNIVEANYGEPGTIGRRYNVPVTDFAGFGNPKNPKERTTGTSDINVDKLIRQAGTLVTTKFGKEQIQSDIEAYAKEGDQEGLQDYIRSVAFSDLGAEEQKSRRIRAAIDFQGDQMKKLIDDYTAAGGDLGIFAGTRTKVGKKINQIDDPQRLELAQRMLIMIEDFARAQTGAAIQDFERKNFEDILPNIFDSGDIAKAKIDAFKGYVKDLDESDLRFRLGDTVYEEVYGKRQENIGNAEDIVNSWVQKSTTNNLYDEYGLN